MQMIYCTCAFQRIKLLNRIRGFDLFTCEAKCHKSCRMQYPQKPEKWRSKTDQSATLQNKLEDAHIKAFKRVCETLEDEVTDRKKVVKLSDLQPIRKALRTPKFVLSEAIYLRTKKSSEAPDKFRCVVRTSDENDSFLRTPALLTLKFCGVIQH